MNWAPPTISGMMSVERDRTESFIPGSYCSPPEPAMTICALEAVREWTLPPLKVVPTEEPGRGRSMRPWRYPAGVRDMILA